MLPALLHAQELTYLSIAFLAIGDDHEIYNDFDSNVTDPAFAPANSAYNNYLGAANPDPIDPGTNYYEFRHGDAAFFVWDTRTYRSPDGAEDDEDKTMLGLRQREVFLNWAARVNNTVTWKFVVSSVPLMSLWSHGSDTWAGFTTERDIIMDVLEYVPNVIAISGDRHEHATASIRNTVTEFSTSPLSMFYLPFRTLSQRHGRGATGEDQLLKCEALCLVCSLAPARVTDPKSIRHPGRQLQVHYVRGRHPHCQRACRPRQGLC